MAKRHKEHFDRTFSAKTPWLTWTNSPNRRHDDGSYFCRHGIVEIYRQPATPDNDHAYVNLRFVWKGKLHIRSWEQEFTRRGCVTLAHCFVQEIVEPAQS